MKEINIFNKNDIYQKFIVLKTNRTKRNKYNEFLVEGVRNINEAIKNNWIIKSFIYDKNNLSNWAINIINTIKTEINYCVNNELLKELSDKNDTSELIAIVQMKENNIEKIKISENPFVVLFDRPSKKGNLGTLVRSCDSFGVDLLLITGHSVDLYDPEVIVSSMGSFFKLSIIRVNDNKILFEFINKLKITYSNFSIIGTTSHKEKPIYNINLTVPLMLMIGNETMGLNKNFKDNCDILCTIPMSEKASASSLNVSCAASILLYEITRQRNCL